MQIDTDVIAKAKEKLGDDNATIIARELDVPDFDTRNLRCCCPFHQEKTPSFIYNKKTHSFFCFGACGRSYDLIDVLIHKGATYAQACQKLFELAEVPYSFGELGVRTRREYRHPKEVICTDKQRVYDYFALRGISTKTVDYLDVRQDSEGNAVFNYYDTNDVLTMVKYRPSRRVKKEDGERKMWCQPGADTTPLLWNMNRINPSLGKESPLIICEGEVDAMTAIEAGFTNVVSVPLGAGNFHWIEENFAWLDQFESIVICADNDGPGVKMQKECVRRLGSWRTKVVEIPTKFVREDNKERSVKDLNEVLYYFGRDKVVDLILGAKDSPVPGVVDFSDIEDVDLDAMDGIPTGLPELDKLLMKLFYGTLNIVTGINGCVSCDTEFFDGEKWKRIDEYEEGDRVLQYDERGNASLVSPEAYHKYPCDSFWKFKSTYGIDQLVSDEHNIVYLTSKGNLAKKSAIEVVEQHERLKNGFQGKFITTFSYSGEGVPLTDEEILVMCAVICDGNIIERKKTGPLCRINLKKQRKKERIRQLLDNANIPYKEYSFNPKESEYRTFIFEPPIATKSFGVDWYRCTQHQLELIANEILFWGGAQRGERASFSTTVKESADFVQFAFSATGRRSALTVADRSGEMIRGYVRKSTEYTVSCTKQKLCSLMNVKEKTKIEKVSSTDGYKYCFTVPSGMLVLRHNGRINITGNSGKSSFLNQVICQCLDRGENAYLFSGELPNFQSRNWLNFIFAGQRNVTQHEYNGSVYYKVTPEAKRAIGEYYRGHLYLREDGYSNKKEELMSSMEDSVRKYGTRLVILDNLTAMDLGAGDSKYDNQAKLVMELIAFAVKYQVVIILVVHPHKIDMMRRLSKMDVQGISAIIDLAHRIISLYRVSEKEKRGQPSMKGNGWVSPPIHADVIIDILKDRMTGYENGSVNVFYDRPSRRFFSTVEELDYQYNWDKNQYTTPLPFPPPQLEEDDGPF